MIAAMKCISLAFDDFATLPPLERLAFVFNPATALFGPFISYRTFVESIRKPVIKEQICIEKYLNLIAAADYKLDRLCARIRGARRVLPSPLLLPH